MTYSPDMTSELRPSTPAEGVQRGRSERVRRRGSGLAELLSFPLDQSSSVPLFRQIYLGLRAAIQKGQLREEARLPSSRDFALALGVSRTSVLSAYEQLLAEGYIEGRRGSGTYVAPLVDAYMEGSEARRATQSQAADSSASKRAQRLLNVTEHIVHASSIAFNTGVCAPDARSFEKLKQLGARHLSGIEADYRGYSEPLGRWDLRDLIAEYLRAARAVECEASNIIVTTGAQQAVDLAVKVLVDPGDPVWVEDPCYPIAHAALRAAGAVTVPVPVDAEGMQVQRGLATCPEARVAYVTPSHQYPLGVTLSLTRRIELLEWARSAGSWIIEDDYDSEFRYDGRPLSSMQGLDQGQRVIYVGTFSKVLLPGLRLGYAVIPDNLIEPFAAARLVTDRQPAVLEQLILRDFIGEGHFTGHIRRMRKVYLAARDQLVDLISRELAGTLTVDAPSQGMHLIARTMGERRDVELAQLARRAEVVARPVSRMFKGPHGLSALMLGFTGFSAIEMQLGISRLRRAFGAPDSDPAA